jgi:hypothetical protein
MQRKVAGELMLVEDIVGASSIVFTMMTVVGVEFSVYSSPK